MFGAFQGLQSDWRLLGRPWRGRRGGQGGDTRRGRQCHTLLSHEIFVRSASAGNFQQTAPERNTAHLTAHTLVCESSQLAVDSLGAIGEVEQGAVNVVRTTPQSRNPERDPGRVR